MKIPLEHLLRAFRNKEFCSNQHKSYALIKNMEITVTARVLTIERIAWCFFKSLYVLLDNTSFPSRSCFNVISRNTKLMAANKKSPGESFLIMILG